MDNGLEKLAILKKRMEKLGIKIEFVGNIPWIYIDKINGTKIDRCDYFHGDHGFTVGFYPVKIGDVFEFSDITEIFKLIRKYTHRIFRNIECKN